MDGLIDLGVIGLRLLAGPLPFPLEEGERRPLLLPPFLRILACLMPCLSLPPPFLGLDECGEIDRARGELDRARIALDMAKLIGGERDRVGGPFP